MNRYPPFRREWGLMEMESRSGVTGDYGMEGGRPRRTGGWRSELPRSFSLRWLFMTRS